MIKKLFCAVDRPAPYVVLLLLALFLPLTAGPVRAESTESVENRLKALEAQATQNEALREKVDLLIRENEALKSKIEALQQQNTASKSAGPVRSEKETTPAPQAAAPAPTAAQPSQTAQPPKTILESLKIRGRFAAGFMKSSQGSDAYTSRPAYSHGSFEVPEAKVQLSLEPDTHNTVLMRANLNNASFNSLDYFYLESRDFLRQSRLASYPVDGRVGRFKLPFGEEMHTNNLVESAVGSNSASNAASYDEGIQLSGKLGEENPLKWLGSVSNGNGNGVGSGTTRDNMAPKAYTAKLEYSPMPPLSLTGSVYTSGGLGTDTCDMFFAGSNARPSGATGWSRTLWEADARWDFEKGAAHQATHLRGAYSDSKAYVRGAFGQLTDDADGAEDRQADYGFVETLYNFDAKFYGAFRYSLVDITSEAGTTLNNVSDCLRYDRYSVAIGYRLSRQTIIRVSYDFNLTETGSGEDPSDTLLAAMIVSEF